MKKIDYGIDAPGVIRNLFIFSAIGFIVALFFPVIKLGPVVINASSFVWLGIACGLTGIWMLVYSMYGKLRHRNRILNMIAWKGNEMVLDVGTGRGLLMIGAAKKLTTGKSTGIDIWNAEDLTKNNIENTINNAVLEGVKDRVEVKNENAMSMSFTDETFDVVISNLCLHNIYNADGRKKACDEIARVLKKEGTGIISDFRHMKEYQMNFRQAGLMTEFFGASYFTTFPPLAILKIRKP
ncbi:MAG TPA: class I SAM-dependent methyltransferase [Chitinophagales bacterium]|nr:class I SAM-dependent methyltransferase [Chitinophagales bacterium]